MPVLDTDRLIVNRIDAIRDFHDSLGVDRAELDVSGGVDSAVMLGLLAHSLGPDRVTAVYQGIDSSQDSLRLARQVAEKFGVPLIEMDLTGVFRQIVSIATQGIHSAYAAKEPEILVRLHQMALADPTILGSLRSCLRAPIGRGVNRMMGGGIRHGTGNECEDRWTRFFQKGGDGEVDTNPIAMLSKGEVYQMALGLGVPEEILTTRPTPDLWGGERDHSDEDEYATYFGFNPAEMAQGLAENRVQGWRWGQITFYSYISTEDGHYTRIGLIERISRLLDIPSGINFGAIRNAPYGDILFSGSGTHHVEDAIAKAPFEAPVEDLPPLVVTEALRAAIRIERATRHKANPNISTLGTRLDLVATGILTNDLPTLEVAP